MNGFRSNTCIILTIDRMNNTLPILFSVPSENGEYQLFGQMSNATIIDPNVYQLSTEELEKIKKKQLYTKLAICVEKYLEKNRHDSYHLTKYTLYKIDEVEAETYVYFDQHDDASYVYYYKIISKNIQYENDESLEKDVLIYESSSFSNVFSLLEHLKKVEETYKFLDYYLLSPEKMEEAVTQRAFFPLHSDKVCCVCYELTVEYTKCKHSICMKCRDKCIVQGKTRCPICRGSDLNIYPSTL